MPKTLSPAETDSIRVKYSGQRQTLQAEKAEAFARAVGKRVQDLGRTALTGLDAKKWVDTIQDKVVLPSILTAEELPFSDPVTFQHVLKAARDFFAASWTSSRPS